MFDWSYSYGNLANFKCLIQDMTMHAMYSPRAMTYPHVKERACVRIPANFLIQNTTLCATMGMMYSAKGMTYLLTCDNLTIYFFQSHLTLLLIFWGVYYEFVMH